MLRSFLKPFTTSFWNLRLLFLANDLQIINVSEAARSFKPHHKFSIWFRSEHKLGNWITPPPYAVLNKPFTSYFSCILQVVIFFKDPTLFMLQMLHKQKNQKGSNILRYIAPFMVYSLTSWPFQEKYFMLLSP